MSKPDDDTDVPSGFNDDAEMERTSPRVSEMVISSPAPTSTSVQTASPRTLGAADEEDGFTVEDPPPAERQPPTPPPARPAAQASPGQQLMRVAFGVEGPPTPPQVNGSVSRIEVDDTRDQTYRSNDATEPLKESPCQKFAHEPHALSTKIHMSDLARSQSVVPSEVSGIVISPVQPDNSNRDDSRCH